MQRGNSQMPRTVMPSIYDAVACGDITSDESHGLRIETAITQDAVTSTRRRPEMSDESHGLRTENAVTQEAITSTRTRPEMSDESHGLRTETAVTQEAVTSTRRRPETSDENSSDMEISQTFEVTLADAVADDMRVQSKEPCPTAVHGDILRSNIANPSPVADKSPIASILADPSEMSEDILRKNNNGAIDKKRHLSESQKESSAIAYDNKPNTSIPGDSKCSSSPASQESLTARLPRHVAIEKQRKWAADPPSGSRMQIGNSSHLTSTMLDANSSTGSVIRASVRSSTASAVNESQKSHSAEHSPEVIQCPDVQSRSADTSMSDIDLNVVDTATSRFLSENLLKTGTTEFNDVFTAYQYVTPDLRESIETAGVLVHGEKPLQPISYLSQASFHKDIKSRLNALGFMNPERIQKYCWPAILRGRNVVALSHSGNILAYLLPLLTQIQQSNVHKQLPMGNGPLAIIMTSSWKTALAIYDCCEKICEGIVQHARALVVYGGGQEENQIVSLINGCELLVTTPYSLERMLQKSHTNLDRLCYLVLHDADVLVEEFTEKVKSLMSRFAAVLKQRPSNCIPLQILCFGVYWTPGVANFLQVYMPEPLVIITSMVEAAVYARVKQNVQVCTAENRSVELNGILRNLTDIQKRVIIFVNNEQDVNDLRQLVSSQIDSNDSILVAVGAMAHNNIQDLRREWLEAGSKGTGRVFLLLSNTNIHLMLITDANLVIHWDLDSKIMFGNRLGCMQSHFAPQLVKGAPVASCSSVVFVTPVSAVTMELLLKRLRQPVPAKLAELVAGVREGREDNKAWSELCAYMKAFGSCHQHVCSQRHVLFKSVDTPGARPYYAKLPKTGIVKIFVVEVIDVCHFFVRILEYHSGLDPAVKMGGTYEELIMDLDMYYAVQANCEALGVPQLGDLCVLKDEKGIPHRARVDRFLSEEPTKGKDTLRVHYVDDGPYRTVMVKQLLKLADRFSTIPFQAVEVFICCVKPDDNDMDWPAGANMEVHKLVYRQQLDGMIRMTLGNTLWLEPLVKRNYLPSIKVFTNEFNVRKEILKQGLGVDNPSHLEDLYEKCEGILSLPDRIHESDMAKLDEGLVCQTDILPIGEYEDVWVTAVMTPNCLFLQRRATEKQFEDLLNQLNESDPATRIGTVNMITKSPCLAYYFVEQRWHRAWIMHVMPDQEQVEVFFMDFGDTAFIPRQQVAPITQAELQLPCQAIECALVNVSPPGDDWTENDAIALWELTLNLDRSLKLLVAKVISTSANPEYTGHVKYYIDLQDTSTPEDIVIGQELVAAGHAIGSPGSVQDLFPDAVLGENMQSDKKTCQAVPSLCAALYRNKDMAERLVIAKRIKEIVFKSAKSKSEVRESGGVRALCKLLAFTHSDVVQTYMLQTLTLLVTGDDTNRDEVCRESGVQAICRLLKRTTSITVQEHATWALATLAANKACCAKIRECGGLLQLCHLLGVTRNDKIVENICIALKSMADDNTKNSIYIKDKGGIKLLCDLIATTNNANILEFATWTIEKLAISYSNREVVGRHKGIDLLFTHLETSTDKKFVLRALSTLKLLTTDHPDNIARLAQCNLLPIFDRFTKKSITTLCADLLAKVVNYHDEDNSDIRDESSDECVERILRPFTKKIMDKIQGASANTTECVTHVEDCNGVTTQLAPKDLAECTVASTIVSQNNTESQHPQSSVTTEQMNSDGHGTCVTETVAEPPPHAGNGSLPSCADVMPKLEPIISSVMPNTCWSQKEEIVQLAIKLRGVVDSLTTVEVHERFVDFRTLLDSKPYALSIDLYECVRLEDTRIMGGEVLIVLHKLQPGFWPRLLLGIEKMPNISLDFERYEDSDSDDNRLPAWGQNDSGRVYKVNRSSESSDSDASFTERDLEDLF
ncbi:PREDICTED: putative ATP-dependent RNA helicase TDRD12 isoform X5 [Priapulus caudatus]|nr:PREDICTED: putative ATP-dependent RNA helicase TDRD12 isoform X5 [Priapulus caudatus]